MYPIVIRSTFLYYCRAIPAAAGSDHWRGDGIGAVDPGRAVRAPRVDGLRTYHNMESIYLSSDYVQMFDYCYHLQTLQERPGKMWHYIDFLPKVQ